MIFGDLYSMDHTWPYLATAAGRPAGEAAAAARQALLHWSPSYSWSLRATWAPHIHDYPWRRSHSMQWNVNIFACYTMICIDLHVQPGFLLSSRYPPCTVPNTAMYSILQFGDFGPEADTPEAWQRLVTDLSCPSWSMMIDVDRLVTFSQFIPQAFREANRPSKGMAKMVCGSEHLAEFWNEVEKARKKCQPTGLLRWFWYVLIGTCRSFANVQQLCNGQCRQCPKDSPDLVRMHQADWAKTNSVNLCLRRTLKWVPFSMAMLVSGPGIQLFRPLHIINALRSYIKTYQDISRHIKTYQDISRHIKTYQDISSP